MHTITEYAHFASALALAAGLLASAEIVEVPKPPAYTDFDDYKATLPSDLSSLTWLIPQYDNSGWTRSGDSFLDLNLVLDGKSVRQSLDHSSSNLHIAFYMAASDDVDSDWSYTADIACKLADQAQATCTWTFTPQGSASSPPKEQTFDLSIAKINVA